MLSIGNVRQSVYVKLLDEHAPHEGGSSFRTWLFAVNNEPGRPADSSQGDSVVEIDVEHLHAVIDEYFRSTEVEAVEVPEWPVRTDSLLALNLEIPLAEE